MQDRHTSRHWKTFLPPAYTWLETAKLSQVNEPLKKSCIVVPVSYDKKLDLSQTPLADSHKKQAEQAAETLHWQGKGELLVPLEDGSQLLLITTSKLKVSAARVAREVGHAAGRLIKDRKIKALTIVGTTKVPAAMVFDGLAQGTYTQALFKAEADKKELPAEVGFWDQNLTANDINEAKALARSVLFARMLQDAPANWLTPPKWAAIAEEHFAGSKAEVVILGRKELETLNMGSFLSVAAASPLDPKLISIKIAGKNPGKKVALIGKGLTFDAGGVSLKPSKGMGEMKYDMSGGAAVMGAAHFLADVQPDVDVHLIIGAVENVISGTATRPGDIVQACNGKTIEILNTDAEGRLVLADLLAYASESKPDLMIDLATLTGAVLHGLGSAGAAVISNNNNVAQYVMNQGEQAGEPFWQLPMWPELLAEAKSDVADLKNIAKPSVNAGTIMGGVFLNEFVGEGISWAHLDIAGTGWNCSATGYPKSGGSGFAIRTLAHICRNFEPVK